MTTKDTRAFVDALFDRAPESAWSMLWTLQDKRSHWLSLAEGTGPMIDAAAKLSKSSDVYVAVSLANAASGEYRRIASKDAAGIVGLWADIDIETPDVHKKWNLPPGEEEARELLDAVGLAPSVLVHSGHGLQAWWLFDEAWMFDSAEDRSTAAQLAQAWNTTLRVRAAEHNWTIDSTFDLARVMRVPGTTNYKGAEPMPVRLLDISGSYFGRGDFDGYCVDDSLLAQLGLTPDRSYIVGALTLSADAQPPFDKFEALRSAEPMFAGSWDRNRRDMHDTSPSAWDMSLASLAVMAGWSDQEVVDLLIASRKKHNDDLKLNRADYYERTITKAHNSLDRELADEAVEELVEDLKAARSSGDDETVKEVRRAAAASLSSLIEIECIGGVKYLGTPPSYALLTAVGAVPLGGANDVLSQSTVRAAIAGETRKVIRRFKPINWDRLAQLFFDLCDEQDTGMESTESGRVYTWVTEFLDTFRPIDDVDAASATDAPYNDGSDIFVFASPFKRWVWLNTGERTSSRDMGRMMSAAGCAPERLNVRSNAGNRTTRSVWKIPASFLEIERAREAADDDGDDES